MNDEPTDTKLARIEDRLDRGAAGLISVSYGGVAFTSMTEVMEFAKLMSLGGVAVPPHCRGNPGVCLAVTLQAIEWKMSPFAVANKSYAVSNKGVDRIAYESQLTHAVIEARAPLVGRLSVRYEGDGDDRVCIVSGLFRGEDEPREWKSPPLGKRRPARNEYGAVKGSPLWDTKPDLQQFYDCSRDWARVYCPDVLMGIYTPDELEELPVGEHARDVTSPNLMERLPGRMGEEGFKADAVTNGLAETPRKAARKRKPKEAEAAPDHDPATGEVLPQTAGASDEKKRFNLASVCSDCGAEFAVGDCPIGNCPKCNAPNQYIGTRPVPVTEPLPQAAQASTYTADVRASNVRCTRCSKAFEVEPDKCDQCGNLFFSALPDRLPESAGEYIVYAEWWISQIGNIAIAERRWEDEAALRDRLSVPIKDRNALRAYLDHVAERAAQRKHDDD